VTKRWTILLLGLLLVAAGWYAVASEPSARETPSHPAIDEDSRAKLQRELERGE
jgi:hypothetical protein